MSGKNNKLVYSDLIIKFIIYCLSKIGISLPSRYDPSMLGLSELVESDTTEETNCRDQRPACNHLQNPSPPTSISQSSAGNHSGSTSYNSINTKGYSQSNSIGNDAEETSSDDSMVAQKGSSQSNSIGDSTYDDSISDTTSSSQSNHIGNDAEETASDGSMVAQKGSSQSNSIGDSTYDDSIIDTTSSSQSNSIGNDAEETASDGSDGSPTKAPPNSFVPTSADIFSK